MADQLYLSYWLAGFTEQNMLRYYEILLRKFPFSRLRPRALLRVQAVDRTEPPLLEELLPVPVDPERVLGLAREFQHADCAYLLETAWDLWRFEGEWKLRPAPLTLSCFGPAFPSEMGEQLLIEFGLDTQFLPQAELSPNLAPVRHNIRALLHLVEDLDASLPAARRLLWSESGENFAERLQEALATTGPAASRPD
jgi:hypothetical protein